MFGATPDKAVFDKAIAELGKKLDVYEVILSKQTYAAGNVSRIFVASDCLMINDLT